MTTNTRQIDSEQWQDFFDRFSRHYKGRAFTVSMRGRDGRLHTIARHLPLLGITAEQKGRRVEVEVIVGDSPDAHVTHVVKRPSHVHVMQVGDGQDNAMEIGSSEGPDVRIEWDTTETAEAELAPATGMKGEMS
jgi:hypothetical protein